VNPQPPIRVLPRGAGLKIAAVVLLLLLEAAFSALIPLSAGRVLDAVLPGRNRDALIKIAEALALVGVAAVLAGVLRDYVWTRLQNQAIASLRQSMFERLQQASMGFHRRAPFDTVLEGFSSDLAAVETAMSMAVPWGLAPLVEAVIALLLMFLLDWRIGLVSMVLVPWIFLAPSGMSRRADRAAAASEEQQRGVLSLVKESLLAQQLIRAFSLEQMGAAAFRHRNDVLARAALRAGLSSAFAERFTSAGVLFVQIFVLCLSGWLAVNGRMTAGVLVTGQMLLLMLSNALIFIVEYLPSLRAGWDGIASIRQVLSDEVLSDDRPPREAEDSKTLPPLEHEIVFDNVAFAYDKTAVPALDGVSLRIAKGSYTAIVGPSGAGKSTLLSLLMRFYDPDSGRVTIDGHDLKTVDPASLRRQMGVVLQDNYIFDASLRDNVRLGRPEATDEALREAIIAAGLGDYIISLPEKEHTLLGESGVQPPEEVIQRLAIARALVRNPGILLLDEAASALAPAGEASVNRTVRELAKTRTVIAVTHRLSSAADAGQLIFFDKGKVVEMGSHFELLGLGGAYADLWRKQAGFRVSADGSHVDVDALRLQLIPILANLDLAVLADLAPYFATETFPPGRDIVRQNDPGDIFYIIARGKVAVWRFEEQSGNTTRLNVLQDGDFFGEITLLTGFPRTATVRTLTVCTCISLERGQFNRLLDHHPEVRKRLSDVALERLQQSARAAPD
jgi:ATP-binding cassette subfamily B protein